MGLYFTNRQTVQFKKNRTAGLSQSIARKYSRQCKLDNQSSCDNAPKKVSLADVGSSATLLASCLGHLKGKCMTKLIKVSIGNNQRIDSWCTSTEILDKNKKTMILLFRCWHYKTKRTKSAEIVWGNEWNEMFTIFNSFCIWGDSSVK